MNFFETDFLQKMSTLLKEAFKFKKYKAMHPVFATFTGILMLPIVVASFSAAAALAILGFFFSFLSYPIKFLHEVINSEGKQVKHATQTVIYLISWPLVFALYVVISFIFLLLVPVYTMFMFFTYVWSLGGFKFHLFANYAEDISIEVEGKYRILPLIYILIGGILVVLIPLIHGCIHFADLYSQYLEKTFVSSFFEGIYPKYVNIHSIFTILFTLIGFARYPKASAISSPNTEE